MKLSTIRVLALAAPVTLSLAATASADTAPADAPAVACVSGQFADHVEAGHPAGDVASIFAAKKAVYFVDVSNPGEATQVTLVWTLDDHEVQRQSLDVGRSPHWHTWGSRPLGDAHKVDVEVLDAAGHSLKKDSITQPG